MTSGPDFTKNSCRETLPLQIASVWRIVNSCPLLESAALFLRCRRRPHGRSPRRKDTPAPVDAADACGSAWSEMRLLPQLLYSMKKRACPIGTDASIVPCSCSSVQRFSGSAARKRKIFPEFYAVACSFAQCALRFAARIAQNTA